MSKDNYLKEQQFIKDNYYNMTTREIGDILGISHQTVILRAKKLGLNKTFVGAEKYIPLPFEVMVEIDIPGYYITSEGRLINLEKGYVVKERIKNGYLTFSVKVDKKTFYRRKHRLLAQAFIPQNNKQQKAINHRDGNKLNNNLLNLEWCTIAENNTHAHQNNLINYSSSITEEQAITIIKLLNKGYSNSQVVKELDYATKSITEKIKNKKTWKHLSYLLQI